MNRGIDPHPIALIGLSGAGKSSIARRLAVMLGWHHFDTDALIVDRAGRDIATIFAQEGEAHFRMIESEALRSALDHDDCIIATGGGIVLLAENRVLLHDQALVVWLDAPTNALIARLRTHDEERPLLSGPDPVGRLEQMRAARAPLYAEVAHLQIETAGKTAEAICAEILQAMANHIIP